MASTTKSKPRNDKWSLFRLKSLVKSQTLLTTSNPDSNSNPGKQESIENWNAEIANLLSKCEVHRMAMAEEESLAQIGKPQPRPKTIRKGYGWTKDMLLEAYKRKADREAEKMRWVQDA
ncbi:MAG: hypothetical protein Q9168_002968 [Polycauliona sp. 1 TL-2023]